MSALDPWDVQFARAAVELGRRRRAVVEELGELFAEIAAALAPAGGVFGLQLVAQLVAVGYDEEALLDGAAGAASRRDQPRPVAVRSSPGRPAVRRDRDERARVRSAGARRSARAAPLQDVAATGPVCGPVELPRGGRDLRLFGSQGEQRAAVLALLFAEQRLAAARTGVRGTLFLDDVMSELDDRRRRLLVAMLAAAGQAIITTTNRQYFTVEELEHAAVIELPLDGSVAPGGDRRRPMRAVLPRRTSRRCSGACRRRGVGYNRVVAASRGGRRGEGGPSWQLRSRASSRAPRRSGTRTARFGSAGCRLV